MSETEKSETEKKTFCIPSGTYEAKVVDYTVGETKNGTPQVLVMFQTLPTEHQPSTTITWYGLLNGDRAQEITIAALLTMGLKGNDLAPLCGGKQTGVLDFDTVLNIVVEDHTYNGKTTSRVSWVNAQPGFRKATNPQTASKIAGLKGAVAAARQATGIKDPGPDFKNFNGSGPIGPQSTGGQNLGF